MNKLTYPLIILLAISLSACGFQLRGKTEQVIGLPDNIFISGVGQFSDLHKEIARQLKASKATVVATSSNADAILAISARVSNRRSMSVDSSNNQSEYELTEGFTFALRAPGGEYVRTQSIQVSRILLAPDTQTLSGSNEETVLRKEMKRQLVNQMMRRISIQLK